MKLYGEVLTSAQCTLFILIICSILKLTGKRAWKHFAWVLIMYSKHDNVHYQYTSQHSHTQGIEPHAYNQWSYKSHDIISSNNNTSSLYLQNVQNITYVSYTVFCVLCVFTYYIKTHGSVSCGPRSRRATREYINRKKENAIFTPI